MVPGTRHGDLGVSREVVKGEVVKYAHASSHGFRVWYRMMRHGFPVCRRCPFRVHGSIPRDAWIFPTTILLYMTFLLHRKIILLMMALSPFGVFANVKSVTKSRLSLGKLHGEK